MYRNGRQRKRARKMDTICESCNDSTERKKQDVRSNIFTQIHVHGHTHTYTLAPQTIPSTNVKTGKITLFGNTKIGSKTIFFRKQEKDYSGSEMNNCLQWGERNL